MASFEKIHTPSLIDSVAEALLAKILSGELQPGDWLPPERDLAEQMGISRSSLHQAVLDLESKGFLSIIPRRGTTVCDYRKYPTAQSLSMLMRYGSVELEQSLFRDMMDTRLWLETECARRACTHIYEKTFREMLALTDTMTQDNPMVADAVYEFHYRLTQASGNSLYAMIFRGFEPILRTLIHQHYSLRPQDIPASADLHRKLLEAIAAKEEQNAQDLVYEIISHGICVVGERYL